MTGVTEPALIVAAGVLAGIVGTAGGITSLISYPALLALGVPAFAANVANNVALVALDVLQVLYKEWFCRIRAEEVLHFRPRPPQQFQLLQYDLSLRDRERCNAQALFRGF